MSFCDGVTCYTLLFILQEKIERHLRYKAEITKKLDKKKNLIAICAKRGSGLKNKLSCFLRNEKKLSKLIWVNKWFPSMIKEILTRYTWRGNNRKISDNRKKISEQARQKQNPREFQERPNAENAVPFNKKMRGKFWEFNSQPWACFVRWDIRLCSLPRS